MPTRFPRAFRESASTRPAGASCHGPPGPPGPGPGPGPGTDRGADQAGLFWSMRPDRPGAFFDHRIWTPVTMRVSVLAGGAVLAARDLTLTFARSGVTRRLVPGNDLPGRFF